MKTNNSKWCVEQIQEMINIWKQRIVELQNSNDNLLFGYECALADVIMSIENILYN